MEASFGGDGSLKPFLALDNHVLMAQQQEVRGCLNDAMSVHSEGNAHWRVAGAPLRASLRPIWCHLPVPV